MVGCKTVIKEKKYCHRKHVTSKTNITKEKVKKKSALGIKIRLGQQSKNDSCCKYICQSFPCFGIKKSVQLAKMT